jgi:hypothetical protein
MKMKLKHLVLPLVVLLNSCGGSLSNEQRQELKEGREKQEIRKVTEAELISETMERGKAIITQAEEIKTNSQQLEKLAITNNIKLKWVQPGSGGALEVEQQIIEAYIMSSVGGDLPDNVQLYGDDSLLYTKPVMNVLPDGAFEIEGMWSLLFSKRDLILSMSK